MKVDLFLLKFMFKIQIVTDYGYKDIKIFIAVICINLKKFAISLDVRPCLFKDFFKEKFS